MLCSVITVLLAMTIGSSLRSFISPSMAETLGGAILIALGIISLYNILLSERKKPSESKKQNILTTVLNTPDKADLDQSGTISANEALLLGTALALDAFGAGIGASMLGYSPALTSLLIACMSGLFVFCGIKIGMLLSKNKQLQHMSFIPPLLLITL